MKRVIRKNHKKKTASQSSLKVIIFAIIISLLAGTIIVSRVVQSAHVLGEKTTAIENENEGSSDLNNQEKVEQPEAPEPTEISNQENEQEAEKAQNEVKNEVEKGTVEKVEIDPTSEKTGESTVRIENTDGTTTERAAPVSTNTSLIKVQNPQAGMVAIRVDKNGTVTLVNNDVTVSTGFPVVIDPKSQTIAIRTPNGVTVINTLPSQALNGVGAADKPTTIQSAVLGAQDGRAYYEVTGTQKRKFLGLMPVTADIQTKINADNGGVVFVNRPWFLNFLGFLYTT